MSSFRQTRIRAPVAVAHGPAEGKQRSARHAVRHGVLARCTVLDNETHENVGHPCSTDRTCFCCGMLEMRNEPNPKNEHLGALPMNEMSVFVRNLMAGELATPGNENRRCETNLVPKADTLHSDHVNRLVKMKSALLL